MAGNVIRMEGLDELRQSLTKETVLAKTRVAGAVAKTAKKIEATARDLAPVGPTGDLKSSIHTTVTGERAEVGPTVRYARFVEFGTYKDAPQPYMWPAADKHEPELMGEIEKVVGNL